MKMSRVDKDDKFYEARQAGNKARRERKQAEIDQAEDRELHNENREEHRKASENLTSIIEELIKRQSNG